MLPTSGPSASLCFAKDMSSSTLKFNVNIANVNIWKRLEKSINALNCGWCVWECAGLAVSEALTLIRCSESSEIGRTGECYGALPELPPLTHLDFDTLFKFIYDCQLVPFSSSPCIRNSWSTLIGGGGMGKNHCIYAVPVRIKNVLCAKLWAKHWECSSDLERRGLCSYEEYGQKQVNRK